MPKAKKNTLKSALTALNLQRQKAEKAAKAANSPYVQKQLKGKGVSKSASTQVKTTADKPKRPPPFTLEDHILCIGEGNFSFARSLCSTVLHSGYPVVATTLDTEELSYKKYSDCQENVEALKELGAVVLFGVDGTKLEKYAELKGQRFSKIVFNFPHAGMGIKDQDRNIVSNQLLLSGFFTSASQYLTSRTSGQGGMSRTDEADNTDGEIYVTLKSGKPYDLWDIKILAKKALCPGRTTDAGLVCKTSFAFDTQLYPGYEHRRTIGFQDGLSKGGNEELLGSEGDSSRSPPRTYVFTLVDKKGKGDIAPGYAMEDDDDIKGKRKTRKGKGDRHVE